MAKPLIAKHENYKRARAPCRRRPPRIARSVAGARRAGRRRGGASRAGWRSACGASEPTSMPAEAASTPASWAGNSLAQPALGMNSTQTSDAEHDREHRALGGGALPVQAEHQRHEGADQRAPGRRRTPCRRSRCPASRSRRPAPARLKTSTVMRIGEQLLLVAHARAQDWRQMFSTKVTRGASSVADAVRLDGRQQRAEEQHLHRRTASCSAPGRAGPAAESSLSSSARLLRHDRSAALATRNIGTKANRM